MEISYTHRAAKQLGKLPRAIQKRIVAKMRWYASQEDPLKFAERLTDYREGEFRFRIGDWRITFDVERNIIYILKVAKRNHAYN